MATNRLKKVEILRNQNEIEQLFKLGSYWHGRHFDVVYRFADSRKVLFAVSKKAENKVVRNFIKRRLREVYRLSKEALPETIHLAIIGRPGVRKADFSTLQREFHNFVSRVVRS